MDAPPSLSQPTAAFVDTSFLNYLESIYPQKGHTHSPWYIVAAVAFSASNSPEAVPYIFKHVLRGFGTEVDTMADQRLLARKLRDALFKSGLTSGYPRAINSLMALNEVMPEELRDVKLMRNKETSLAEYEKIGRAAFQKIYGETADSVQGILDTIYPDMGWFSNTIGYGLTYGFTGAISPIETSYVLVASLIAGDTPRQIIWHLDGALRAGASLKEVQAVRQIAMEVANRAGVRWKDGVPEVEEARLLSTPK